MVSKEMRMKNEEGLHARPATDFTTIAGEFQSKVTIHKDDMDFNGKSILKVLSACVCQGDTFTLITDGIDEEAAMKKLSGFIENLND
ncbi:HPr family phosphocarrier protein [Lachnospiraceae bacterium OF09-6]|nr:HPr family phosphocarrier protein [Lachnospiraceae bacterium OF09-6]